MVEARGRGRRGDEVDERKLDEGFAMFVVVDLNSNESSMAISSCGL
jgi:hypothetical protein